MTKIRKKTIRATKPTTFFHQKPIFFPGKTGGIRAANTQQMLKKIKRTRTTGGHQPAHHPNQQTHPTTPRPPKPPTSPPTKSRDHDQQAHPRTQEQQQQAEQKETNRAHRGCQERNPQATSGEMPAQQRQQGQKQRRRRESHT